MDMVPVRAEWRPAMEDTDAEYAKCIQQRDHQDGETYRGGSVDREAHSGAIGDVDKFNYEDSVHRANQQGAGITHKDLRRLKIEDQEGQEAAGQ